MKKEHKRLWAYGNYLVKWLQNHVYAAGFSGVVLGLSGGVDSALAAALAKRAFPDTALALIMPIGKMGQDLDDAHQIATAINIPATTIDLTTTFQAFKQTIAVKQHLALVNIKPRLRMTALYAYAQEHGYLVLGTDNAAEWLLGYFTKHGDGAADLLPLSHLTKGEVKTLAMLHKLPPFVYQKAPSAGLWANQTDEAELGLCYDDVDRYLRGERVTPAVETKIKRYEASSRHKKQPALVPLPLTNLEFLKK